MSRVVLGGTARLVQGGQGKFRVSKDGPGWAKYPLVKTTFSYAEKNKMILGPIGYLRNKGFGLKIELVHTLHRVPF